MGLPARLRGLAWVAGLANCVLGCGTVDPGTYEGVRDVKPDENYFYCVIQPQVLNAKKCATGEGGDSGCHATATPMRLQIVDTPVPCLSGKPDPSKISGAERANYTASSLRVNRDVESSPFLRRPIGASGHKVLFASSSTEADLIRKWVAGAR